MSSTCRANIYIHKFDMNSYLPFKFDHRFFSSWCSPKHRGKRFDVELKTDLIIGATLQYIINHKFILQSKLLYFGFYDGSQTLNRSTQTLQ